MLATRSPAANEQSRRALQRRNYDRVHAGGPSIHPAHAELAQGPEPRLVAGSRGSVAGEAIVHVFGAIVLQWSMKCKCVPGGPQEGHSLPENPCSTYDFCAT